MLCTQYKILLLNMGRPVPFEDFSYAATESIVSKSSTFSFYGFEIHLSRNIKKSLQLARDELRLTISNTFKILHEAVNNETQ